MGSSLCDSEGKTAERNNGTRDSVAFSRQIWNVVLQVWYGVDNINISLAKKPRTLSIASSQRNDLPDSFLMNEAATLEENALYMLLFSDGRNGTATARKDWTRTLFE